MGLTNSINLVIKIFGIQHRHQIGFVSYNSDISVCLHGLLCTNQMSVGVVDVSRTLTFSCLAPLQTPPVKSYDFFHPVKDTFCSGQ